MAQKNYWEKVKTGSKAGFDKTWAWADKLGAPVNKLSNKLGSEAFWPTTLDKECEKAARILRSFCKDGFYEDEVKQPLVGPKQKQRVLKKIPTTVIRNAMGIAIFTTMRTGLWVSGAGGSGVLLARKDDGMWSPPSGILLHTAGLGFLVGVDIYDCVVILNTQQAVDAFSKVRCTIGAEISAVAGPAGVGGVVDSEVHKRHAPLFTYLKSRGFYAGVQVDGTVIIERSDENERFYGYRVPVAEILKGKVRHPPREIDTLIETLKAAQGETGINEDILTDGPPPADYEVEDSVNSTFGIPDKEDPDPFGVLALEKEGLVIREAGTKKRVTSEYFDFKPSPTSPVYRRSLDSPRRESWRNSSLSMNSPLRANYATSTASTQTDFDTPMAQHKIQMEDNDIVLPSGPPPALPPRRGGAAVVDEKPRAAERSLTEDPQTVSDSPQSARSEAGEDSDDDGDEEEPVVYEVAQGPATQVATKPRMITVPKLAPPILPPRNPSRSLRSPSNASSQGEEETGTKDQGVMTSDPPSPGQKSVSEASFKSASSKGDKQDSPISSPSPPTRHASPLSNTTSLPTSTESAEAAAASSVEKTAAAPVDEPAAESIGESTTALPVEDSTKEPTAAGSLDETAKPSPVEEQPSDIREQIVEIPASPSTVHTTGGAAAPTPFTETPMSDIPLNDSASEASFQPRSPLRPALSSGASALAPPTPREDGPHLSMASIRGGLSPVKSNEDDDA